MVAASTESSGVRGRSDVRFEAASLRVLGPPELQAPGAVPLQFLPERRFRLLAYLAIRNDWAARDALATLFWPERSQESARSNLRKLLLEVRALPVSDLEFNATGLRWKVATDVAQFREALAQNDRLKALTLYRGPLLQGIDGGGSTAFAAWLDGERQRLRCAWRDCAVAELPSRTPASAVELAQALLLDDPFDEDAVVAALEAHRALGQKSESVRVFRDYAAHLLETLGVEPSARVRNAAEPATAPARSAAQAAPAHPAVATGPTQATATDFVGRTGELEELSALLANPECRLLTVTGTGGIGKSRLVKQAVRELEANYSDGATWIALDDLTNATQVAPRIAAQLSLPLAHGQDPVERIASHFAARRMLLVLDNCEHLPDLADSVQRLLTWAPQLQVLATSRAQFGLAQEWLLPLAGLALPRLDVPVSDIVAADAVRLFAAHARATDPRFNTEANAAHVARLVHAVGGLPLAIQIAASWVRLLPMAELLQEVLLSLDVLEAAEEGEERAEHRSVRATFEQSWRLLAPQEQRALAALSVLLGAFNLAAARGVADARLPLLASLVDKSLLQSDGTGHFALHPLIQQFAAEKLALDAAVASSARAAHGRHFDLWLRRISDVPRAEEGKAMREIEQALENLRAMWRHAISTRAWDTLAASATPLMRFFELRSRWDEGTALLDEADAALAEPPAGDRAANAARANVWRAQSTLDFRLGANERCMQRATRSLALCRDLGIRKGIKGNLNCLGLAAWQLNRRDEASSYFAQAIAEARADGDIDGEAMFLGNAGLVEKARGDFARALTLTEQALAAHRARKNEVSIRITLNNMGNLLRALQRPQDAIRVLNEALATSENVEQSSTLNFVLCNLALAHDDLGEFTQALLYAERAFSLMGRQGEPALETSIRHALARSHIGLAHFEQAQAHLARAVQLALGEHRTGVMVGTLMHWGCWHAARGDTVRAIAMLRIVAAHDAIDGPDRDMARRVLAVLTEAATPELLAAAALDARRMTVEQLAAQLVVAGTRSA